MKQIKIRSVYLSVISEFWLSLFVARPHPTLAYLEALNIYQKIPHFLLYYPNMAVLWVGRQHCPIFLHKNECVWCTYLHQTFTEFISNQYTDINLSIYQVWLQVMEHLLILLRFYLEFSYIIDEYSCLNYCITNKLSEIVCLINVQILIC